MTYIGPDTGVGTWKCSKCSGACPHQSAAEVFMGRVYGREPLVEDEGIGDPDNSEDIMLVDRQNNMQQKETAISFLPVRPPHWAELDTDIKHYDRASLLSEIPCTIRLEVPAQSMCGIQCVEAELLGERIVRTCTVYTLTEGLTCNIELVPCPSCHNRKHCFIGPETCRFGIFNFNNSVLFTHELMDEYTSRFTSSETPFVAFVETIERNYRSRGSQFVKEDLFCLAWFAYASIQDFSKDMSCPRCAEEPACVIFEGVTLAFGKKHLQDSLRPPTFASEGAIVRQRTYPVKPQLVQEQSKMPIRRLMKSFIRGKRSSQQQGEDDNEEDDDELWDNYEVLVQHLKGVLPALANLFERTVGPKAKIQPALRQRYGVFLEQIAAEEYATQMISFKSLRVLKGFTDQPSWTSATKLVDIPALYHVLEFECKLNNKYPEDLLAV
ncbi:hypothetical protein PM082_002385 [Marasmius tenuissimus]|nr:hypothetical protein PM082_002385 [Marasmius tenuissimus]